MTNLFQTLQTIVDIWDSKKSDPLVIVNLAIQVFQNTRTILEPASTLSEQMAKMYAKTINHICSQRAIGPTIQPDASPDIEETRMHLATTKIFMYIVECQLRLALVQAKQCAFLNNETNIGIMNERVSQCTFDAPDTPNQALSKALFDFQTDGFLQDEMHNMLAYTVCLKDGAPTSTVGWVHIDACEVITSHAYAVETLNSLFDTFRVETFLKEDNDDERVRTWHARVCESQHTDEFMVEIVDALIKIHMYECESLNPETVRAYRESKPRKGYHWYTRLRVAREGDGCDQLYIACNVRTAQMPESMKSLTLLSYIEYYMRHAGVESWLSLCFIDSHYPKHALETIEFRRHLPLGHPKMPPLLFRTSIDTFSIITFENDGAIGKRTPSESIHEAFATWCRIIITSCGGFLAPRISCMSMIETVLAISDKSDTNQINLIDEVKQAPTFALF